MSDAVEMVPDRRRADSLSGCRPLGLTTFRCVARRRSGIVRRDFIGAWHRPKQAVSAGWSTQLRWRWTRSMIVLGADTHKRSHTIAAVSAATGELVGERTVQVGAKAFAALVVWARELGSERVWALEDCRHVSGSFRAVSDRPRRARGACDDEADGRLASPRSRSREVRQHRCDRGRASGTARRLGRPAGGATGGPRSRSAAAGRPPRAPGPPTRGANNTLQWNLHDLWPKLRLPGSSLFYGTWGPRVARRLARSEQTMRVRIARDQLRRIRELSAALKTLEAEIAQLVAHIAPQLLAEPGLGPLTAAQLVGEIAGADRFAADAKLARAAGIAPIPVSSGKTNRHRLDRGGNRQINATIHRIAITRLR